MPDRISSTTAAMYIGRPLWHALCRPHSPASSCAQEKFGALDPPGKSVASRDHREDCKARADSRRRAFSLAPTLAQGRFNSSKPSPHVVSNSFTNWKRLTHQGPSSPPRNNFVNFEFSLHPSGKSLL